MGRKKKGRATRSAKAHSAQEPEDLARAPHTFVIKRGSVGRTVNNLITDVRKVMEPYTASQLKVGKQNVLKDFISVAGPLHVTHIMAFSLSEISPNLRIMRLPRGPTLTFRVENFSLMRDVVSSLKKPQGHAKQYEHPPLLVLNNFKEDKMENRLTTTMLQSMFPSLNVTKIKLNQVRRCVLFNYDAETGKIEFRHYNVRATPHGMSKAVKKIVRGKIPDLSRHQDISDFLTQGDILSESEGEDNDPDNKMTLPQELSSRGNMANQVSAIRLTELGPRMTLELVKIEEDVCAGEIMYHKFIHKTEEEIKDLRRARILRQTRKADLTLQQQRNVERKQQDIIDHKERCVQGAKRKHEDVDAGEESEGEDEYQEKGDVSDDDDAAWFEEEVGEKPEPGMLGNLNIRRGTRGRGMTRRGRGRSSFGNFGSRPPYGSDRSGEDQSSRGFGGRGFRRSRGRGSDRGESRGRGMFRGSDRGRGSSRGSSRGRGFHRGSSRGSGSSRGAGPRNFDSDGRGRPIHKAVAYRRKSSFSGTR